MATKKLKTIAEVFRSLRKSWGNVKPVTRIEKDKKKYDRKRFKKGE